MRAKKNLENQGFEIFLPIIVYEEIDQHKSTSLETMSPSISISPEAGAMNPAIRRRSEVFPLPELPRITRRSELETVRLISFNIILSS